MNCALQRNDIMRRRLRIIYTIKLYVKTCVIFQIYFECLYCLLLYRKLQCSELTKEYNLVEILSKIIHTMDNKQTLKYNLSYIGMLFKSCMNQ